MRIALSPIRAPQGQQPLCCSCAQERGKGWGVCGGTGHVPAPEHPQLRGGTETVTVRATGACFPMIHTGKDGREEERSGLLFASWEQQVWAPQRQL